MPAENLEEQGLEKNPNLELAQTKFLLTLAEYKQDAALKAKLLEAIRTENMAPWYEHICTELGWAVDKDLLARMKEPPLSCRIGRVPWIPSRSCR